LAGIALLIVSGCSTSFDKAKEKVHETKNPDAEEVLTLNPDADIFQFNGVIYQTGIDWVDELTLSKDEQVGEILTRNKKDTDFENGMSNELPVGTKIFSAKERKDILIAVSPKATLKYLAIVEG
jgi:protein involved in sex pheromone biosynthesis